MGFEDKLVSGKELESIKRKRGQLNIFENIKPKLQEEYEVNGWSLDKKFKNHVKMKRAKPLDEVFEDELWVLLADMGFNYLNRDRYFKMPSSQKDSKLTQQIDVFAADDETVLFVECKATESQKKGNFKEAIQSIIGVRESLFKAAKSVFPKSKIKFIFATKNYHLSEYDIRRLEESQIQYFNENAIGYYSDLVKHIGKCAKFQLLGYLFAGQKILGMNNKVPAIQGKMGGHTYYSFSIEPERLLKISYVLHRNEANQSLMPTYQRLIKKKRLIDIQKFVNLGGYFPNSLIVNIDTKGNKIQFDLSKLQESEAISRIGILHLPQQYRSVYVIDGQHRLYAYANSQYSSSNTIPIVAFVGLAKENQIKLFMEINENQKSVPKNLQNTLSADLLWSSPDWNQRRKALRLHIAQKLGEDNSSPLYGKVIIGENESNPNCCVTIETVQKALQLSNFFSQFGKNNAILKDGTYDKGENETTFKVFFPFIAMCFGYIKENLSDEWEKGENENGVLVINNVIYALILIFSDVVDYLISINKINPKNEKPENIVKVMQLYLDPIVTFIRNMPIEQRKEIRQSYGSGGKTKVCKILQKEIHEKQSGFCPKGLKEWCLNNTRAFNKESLFILQSVGEKIKKEIRRELEIKYGDGWLKAGIPQKIYTRLSQISAKINYENGVDGENVEYWDCIEVSDCKEIVVFGKNWSSIFEDKYTRPEDKNCKGGKKNKIKWLETLAKLYKQDFETYSVTEREYKFLHELNEWLIKL